MRRAAQAGVLLVVWAVGGGCGANRAERAAPTPPDAADTGGDTGDTARDVAIEPDTAPDGAADSADTRADDPLADPIDDASNDGAANDAEPDDDGDVVDGSGDDTTGTTDGSPDGSGEGLCGDGVLDEAAGEACDDGDRNSATRPGACRPDCRPAFCGDGVTDPGERCDDGNADRGDGCEPDCRRTVRAWEGVIDLADADAVIEHPTPGGRFGAALAIGDVLDVGGVELIVGAPDEGSDGRRGAVFVFAAVPVGGVDASAARLRLEGETRASRFGASVAVGDITGDGVPDLVVGAPGADGVRPESGAVYVYPGPIDPEAPARWKLSGSTSRWRVGESVAIVPDVTGDGAPDLVIGAPGLVRYSRGYGGVLVVRGPVSADRGASDGATTFFAERAGDQLGLVVGHLPDQNGDGRAELVVGTPFSDYVAEDSGTVYQWSLGIGGGSVELYGTSLRMYGRRRGDQLGASGVFGMDADRDGFADFFVGAPFADDGSSSLAVGGAFLFRGPLTGVTPVERAWGQYVGRRAGGRTGASVAWVRGLDPEVADGVAIGAPLEQGQVSGEGAVYIDVAGPGTRQLSEARAVLRGPIANGWAGSTLLAADLVGTGRDALVIGAPGSFVDPVVGRVYVLYPRSPRPQE